MRDDNRVYVGHMLDLALQARGLTESMSRADFNSQPAVRLAVAHLLQTIGEAARRVSDEFRALHPQVPWDLIVGMRHKIVHDYLDIDFDVVWQTTVEDIPALIAMLTPIVDLD